MALALSERVTIIVEAALPAPPPTPPEPTYSITLTVDKTSGRVGDTFRFTCTVKAPKAVYLVNIVDAADTVLGSKFLDIRTTAPVTTGINWTADEAGTYIVHAELLKSWLPPLPIF